MNNRAEFRITAGRNGIICSGSDPDQQLRQPIDLEMDTSGKVTGSCARAISGMCGKGGKRCILPELLASGGRGLPEIVYVPHKPKVGYRWGGPRR